MKAEISAQIEKIVNEARSSDIAKSGWLQVEQSERIVRRGRQTFAVFGRFAYDATPRRGTDDAGNRYAILPVIQDGAIWGKFPEEGRSQILAVMSFIPRPGKPRRWMALFTPRGWIHTGELEQTDAQIADNIAAEIVRGKTPLTGGRQGWD